MKIAFVNPPRISRQRAVEAEDCCWGAGPLVLPSMLLACASEAQQAGHEVAFIDLAIDEPEVLREFAPGVVVHALAWQWWHEVDVEMRRACRNIPRIVLAVPPGCAQHYTSISSDNPAWVIYSEPEAQFFSSAGWDSKNLLAWRYGPGCIARACEDFWYPFRARFDKLGPIDYSLVKPHYWTHYKAAVYQVTRGCPYRCSFCVWGGSTVTDTTFKMRPARQVADNIKKLREIAGRHREKPLPLYLLAAQLTTSAAWLREFHAEMAGDPYPFQSNVNLGEVTPENVALLKEAGLVSCASGLDAISDEVLALMQKPYDFEQALEGLLVMQDAKLLRRVRVRYGVGETEAAVAESCENLDKIKAAGIERIKVAFAPIIHYEGTVIREQAEYELKPLPGDGPERLVMAETPDWSPFVDKLREMDWLGRVGPRK